MRHQPNTNTQLVSSINVTPLIDVLLCLLIIFMIAMPLISQRLSIAIQATTAADVQAKPMQVRIDANGRLTLDQRPITEAVLAAEFAWQSEREAQTRLLLDADADVPFQRVAEILVAARSNGIQQIAMQQ